MKKRYIQIKTQFRGFHKYENAPEKVAFLRNIHRHIFKVEVTIEVFENDREIEFFMAQDILDQICTDICAVRPLLGSCEQIAEWILDGLINQYRERRFYSVSVSEDGENAGVVDYEPR